MMKRKRSLSDSKDAPIYKRSCKDSLGMINFILYKLYQILATCVFTSTFPYM